VCASACSSCLGLDPAPPARFVVQSPDIIPSGAFSSCKHRVSAKSPAQAACFLFAFSILLFAHASVRCRFLICIPSSYSWVKALFFIDMRAADLGFTAAPNFSWRLDSVNRLEVFVSRARSVFHADIARGPVLMPQRFSLPIFICTGPSSSGSWVIYLI
jgi:hypothetical protein